MEKKDTEKINSDEPLENESPFGVELNFLENDTEVRGTFFPSGSGESLTNEYVEDILRANNVVHGIQTQAIAEAVLECNNGVIVKDVVVAKGTPPANEIAEYVQLNPILASGPTESSDGHIEYKDASPFIIVKKNQVLAKQKSRKLGRPGINVRGASVPFGFVKPEGVAGGENTKMEGKFLLSNINGQMIVAGSVVSVQDFLEIKGPVGYKTGNIIFPGNVIIHGTVSDGFKIYSGGSVTIKQTFDVTDVNTKGDLNVAGGIIGRGSAMVKVGGGLNTKFIENCRVACRKTISVAKEIITSNVYTLESVQIEKGRIIGGEIWAINGVRAGAIGKISGKATRIHCGIDFTVQQEKEKYNNLLRLIAVKLGKIRHALEDPAANDERKAKLNELVKRMEEERKKASDAVISLLGKHIAKETASVEVSGEIVAGTLIEICQLALFITSPLKNVRIRVDSEAGKLITEELGK